MPRASEHRTNPASAAPAPARQGSIRDANLALLYRLIIDAPTPVSRAALAAATGMTRATASALADALLAANLVHEVSPPPATGAGRPAAGLVPAPTGPLGLGLEINVDYLAACVVDLAGRVRGSVTRHGDQRGRRPAEVLRELAELARELAGAPGHTVAGAAVAVPGLVEGPHGRIRRAPNLAWQDVEIAAELRGLLPDARFEPVVGNEADFAALAEAHAVGGGDEGGVGDSTGGGGGGAVGPSSTGNGAGPAPSAGNGSRPAELGTATRAAVLGTLTPPAAGRQAAPLTDFLYVSGEIGVGAGIVLGGEVFRGARGWAGEIGHVTVEPGGALCRCGARGCLETVAGLEALHRRGPVTAAAALGRAIAAAVNLFDLPAVVLGGVYARADLADALVPKVSEALAEHVVSAAWSPIAVQSSRWGEAAAAIGAATSVIRQVHADPAAWVG